MNSTQSAAARRTPILARAGVLLGAVVAVAGCGSTSVTGAGGGAPGPARTIGAAPSSAAPTASAVATPAATAPAASARPTAFPLVTADALPSGAVPPGPSTPAPVCSPEGVSPAVGEVAAAMGLRVMSIRLTNCGTRSYTLNGRPGIRVLDAERAPLAVTVGSGSAGIATLENFDAAAKPVTLRPGETAEFQVAWRNTVTAGDRVADHGRFLDVAPLPGRPRLTVPAELDLGTTGKLGVSPWTKSAETAARTPDRRPGQSAP
ncbi:DUF4232 domain-containing protein [Streptomyces sp. BE20]|uniref:DUF4232 domain-containing protein n=1 Tax=Streptomyces sp. BE20 TaxID=3002525 RepID=UPI002E78F179|nr:DUF4232 domain-containing protein [Streptomyces sp. BE20]MEE1823511.1 DUF4232 domain-containing protein [Streptomyces sp. BE20]